MTAPRLYVRPLRERFVARVDLMRSFAAFCAAAAATLEIEGEIAAFTASPIGSEARAVELAEIEIRWATARRDFFGWARALSVRASSFEEAHALVGPLPERLLADGSENPAWRRAWTPEGFGVPAKKCEAA